MEGGRGELWREGRCGMGEGEVWNGACMGPEGGGKEKHPEI